jgi:hypothetical protein
MKRDAVKAPLINLTDPVIQHEENRGDSHDEDSRFASHPVVERHENAPESTVKRHVREHPATVKDPVCAARKDAAS